MKKVVKYLTLLLVAGALGAPTFAQQDPPNDANWSALSGNALSASKIAATPINYYTGMANISVPLYSYSHHNGLSLNVSLDYFSGGVQVNAIPESAGSNWYLNAGGVVTRTVRGMPDDIPTTGFLYSGAIPQNYASYGGQYYHDSLDAQQDVFQFNFNGRSGKFYIGKNKKIVVVPLTKLNISYTTQTGNDQITGFTIRTEDGVKYVFKELEYEIDSYYDFLKCGYNNIPYTTAWYLTQMIAPFGTDTISFSYNTTLEYSTVGLPQVNYVRNSDHSVVNNYTYFYGKQGYLKKISSITFPDKKNLSVIYDRIIRTDGTDSVINRIRIGDSIFRYGYKLDYIPNSRANLKDV